MTDGEAQRMRSDDDAELLYDWATMFARPNQLEPPGNWNTWLVLAGRGFGKTRTSAEWIRSRVERGQARRVALLGRTSGEVRDVMIEGESGILACSPPWMRPVYEPSKRRLTWPNGAVATTFTADEPDMLRGPQFDTAWCDELASFRFTEAWDNLRFGLRLGKRPRVVVSTTPRPVQTIRDLIADPSTHVTTGSSYENKANLAEDFFTRILAKYEGTRLGTQEIHAHVLDDTVGALWIQKRIDDARVRVAPPLKRVVVAIDPSVTSGAESDEAGIIVAGVDDKGHAYVLEDLSAVLSPDAWAREAVRAYKKHHADRIVAETNNGGDMVEITLRTVDKNVSYKKVHASRGKAVRAEPIGALYEQCIARGSRVATELGDRRIEDVRVGERVWTRAGLRRVLWAGSTGIRATIELRTRDACLRLTEDHEVFVPGRGFVRAGLLVPKKDMTLSWNTRVQTAVSESRNPVAVAGLAAHSNGGKHAKSLARLWSSTACASFLKRSGITVAAAIEAVSCYIARYGNTRTEAFPTAGIFTTSTENHAITDSKTLRRWLREIIPTDTNDVRGQRSNDTHKAEPRNGGGKSVRNTRLSANSVNGDTKRERQNDRASVARNATLTSGIVSVENGPSVDVFDLCVEGQPEFFAESILVHNCKVHHVGALAKLESQMCTFIPGVTAKSPDRMDALVWALTDLMLEARDTWVDDFAALAQA